MRVSILAALLLALAILTTSPSPALADNVILTVKHNPSGSNEFPTIQAAIDHAKLQHDNPANTSTFTISVLADPVPYSGPFTPIDDVQIVGTSTAGTFITGSGSGAVVTVNTVSNVAISNLTFPPGATLGISVSNGNGIDIRNNIFEMGTAATAVLVQNSKSTTIINNTFYGNGTAISTNSTDTTISNDIFSNNGTAILAQGSLAGISFNDFFGNASNGVADLGPYSIPNQVVTNADPRFVAPLSHDFHLRSDSPARNAGNPKYPNSFDAKTSDMGAYGGPDADTTLLPVTGLTSSLASGSTVLLKWDATSDSTVTAYRIYQGTTAASLDEVISTTPRIPVPVGTNTTVVTVPDVTTPAKPAAPTAVAVTPSDHALQVTWTPVLGATGYQIYYSSQTITAENVTSAATVIVGADKTSFTIGGLQNGTTYFVRVAALAQTQLFFGVTAVRDITIKSNRGSSNESPLSQLAVQGIGAVATSVLSTEVSDFPEAIAPFPNLKKGGCFIATAAYGFYSTPQVQALRMFRDRYLMTSAPGRAFVAWYYRVGPRGARYLNQHPWLKAPVRLLLLPLVLTSMVLVYTSPLTKLVCLLGIVVTAQLARRKRRRTPCFEMGEVP
jgi:hypothetical protein